MPPFFFWLFALVMLGFGAAVVINRNPIASALSLVLCFMGLSALVHVARRVLHRHHSGARLCRRGHGAFPFHHHAARSPRRRAAEDERGRGRRRFGRRPGFLSPGLFRHRAAQCREAAIPASRLSRRRTTSTTSAFSSSPITTCRSKSSACWSSSRRSA